MRMSAYYDWAQLSNCPVIECRAGLRSRYYRIVSNDTLPTMVYETLFSRTKFQVRGPVARKRQRWEPLPIFCLLNVFNSVIAADITNWTMKEMAAKRDLWGGGRPPTCTPRRRFRQETTVLPVDRASFRFSVRSVPASNIYIYCIYTLVQKLEKRVLIKGKVLIWKLK